MDKIQKILVNKEFKDKLSHFYILEPNFACESEDLVKWSFELIQNIYLNKGKNISETQIENHIDILTLSPEGKNYSLKDFEEFFRFLNHKADILNRKYIIIKDAHLLSIKVANKLLKTLEEPPIEVCMIMLNNKKVSLLETIVSRGIEIRVQNPKEEVSSLNIPEFNDHLELTQKVKKNPSIEEDLQKILLTKIEEKDVNIKFTNAVQEYFGEFQNDRLYNNPINSRIFKLFNLLKSIA